MNWKREIQIVCGSKTFSSDKFNVSFTYNFDGTVDTINQCSVQIYNLSKSTISSISPESTLIINAGYKNDIGNIFRGMVLATSTAWSGPDKITTVFGADATDRYLNAYVSKVYKENTRASSIILDLVSQLGLKIGQVQLANDIQYTKGIAVDGKLRKVLESICNDASTNLQIVNGTILIRAIGQGNATGVVLSPDTGLLASPEKIDDLSVLQENPDTQADYSVRSLLNYRIGVLSRVRIKSRELESDAVVVRGSHTGSMTGSFETQCEVKLVDGI